MPRNNSNVIPMPTQADLPLEISKIHRAALDKAISFLNVIPGISYHVKVGVIEHKAGEFITGPTPPKRKLVNKWAQDTGYLEKIKTMKAGDTLTWERDEAFVKRWPQERDWNSFTASVNNAAMRYLTADTYLYENDHGRVTVIKVTE